MIYIKYIPFPFGRYTQDKEKGIKYTTVENHQFTKEDSKKGTKEQRKYKTSRKQQDGNSQGDGSSSHKPAPMSLSGRAANVEFIVPKVPSRPLHTLL